MSNIFLVVEGETEEKFYKEVFASAFPQHSFYVAMIPQKKNARRRKNKGGAVSEDVIRNFLIRLLKHDATHCEKVILILDYYGLSKQFISFDKKSTSDLYEAIERIEKDFEEKINSQRFKFILQVHEFEAFLFSRPDILADELLVPEKEKDFNSILNSYKNNPELINDHKETSPYNRIKNIVPSFRKTSQGGTIAKRLGVSGIREKCRNFNKLCTIIERIK